MHSWGNDLDHDNRLHGADFVRASACMIVLFHHLAQRINFNSRLGSDVMQALSNGGGLGVGMFFVLSGFLLSLPFWKALDAGDSLPSLRVYWIRRAARILPGFWLALTVTFILSFTIFGAKLDFWLWLRFLAGFFLLSDWHWLTLFPVEVNGPLWSIGFEVTAYALLPLGFMLIATYGRALSAQTKRLAWLAVIGLALVAHLAFSNLVQVDPAGRSWEYGLQGGAKVWMPWFNPFSFFAMFATGALAGGIRTLLAGRRDWMMDVLCALAVLTAGFYIYAEARMDQGELYGWLRVPYRFPLMHLLVGAVLVFGPGSIIVGRLLDNRATRYIAQVSFGVYVWHYLVLELVRELWMPRMVYGRMIDGTMFWTASGVVIAVSFLIATLSCKLLEEPIIRKARAIEARAARRMSIEAA